MSSSSYSRRRRFHVRRHPVVVDIGCSCRKPRLFSLLNLSVLSRNGRKSSSGDEYYNSGSSSSTTTTTITNSTFSPTSSSSAPAYVSPRKEGKGKGKGKGKREVVVEESVAVEKESSDPYVDFKESMVQMIVEKEMYEWEELREMLRLFLSLNSPYHHHLILRAFTEIWEGLFSPPS